MATLKSINISLVAKTSKFEKRMKKMARVVNKFGRRIGAIAKKLALFGTAIIGVGIAIGTAMVKSSLKAIDTTTKLADALGIATGKLVELQFAAELTGAGAEGLNKGLKKMTINLGDASAGIGEALPALKSMGIDIAAILQLSPDKQFALIADGINKIQNPTLRAEAAFSIFGKSGIDLVNTLALGSEGLAEIGAEAQKLGVAFNRVDAAKIEMANDAILRMKQFFVGIANQLTINLAPIIKTVADNITQLGLDGQGATGLIRVGIEKLAIAFGTIIDVFTLFKSVWLGVAAFIRKSFANLMKSIGFIVQTQIDRVNLLIAGLNKVPGVKIRKIEFAGFDVSKEFKEKTQDLKEQSKKLFESFLSQEGVNKIRENLRKLQIESDKTSKALAAISTGRIQAGPSGPSSFDKVFDAVLKLGKKTKDIFKSIVPEFAENLKNKTEDALKRGVAFFNKITDSPAIAAASFAIGSGAVIDTSLTAIPAGAALAQEVPLKQLKEAEKQTLELKKLNASFGLGSIAG